MWVDSRGALPDGVRLSPGGVGVQVAPDNVETPSLVPHHQVLLTTFELKSKAFMLTYNSRSFKVEDWGRFLLFVKKLRKALGARAYAASLEQSSER